MKGNDRVAGGAAISEMSKEKRRVKREKQKEIGADEPYFLKLAEIGITLSLCKRRTEGADPRWKACRK